MFSKKDTTTKHRNIYDMCKHPLSLTVILISLTSLFGWWFDHQSLAKMLPSIANMTFNTALCFFLLAIAIYSSWFKYTETWWKCRIGIALFIVTLACLTLIQDVFGLKTGVDLLFFDASHYQLNSLHVGRMSPNTSWAFILSGICLILLSHPQLKTKIIKNTSHALIILISFTALIGMAMGTFFHDIPQDFAHFASISLLTAISFLFIALSLIILFQSCYPSAEQNPILYSGIQLMYKLSYPKKFALISLTLLIPLSFLMWQEISSLNHEVTQAKLKITGLQHIRQTSYLLQEIPEHRGMLNAYLMNSAVFKDELFNKKKQVNRLLKDHQLMNKDHISFISDHEWSFIIKRWNLIQDQQYNTSGLWDLHTEIITQLTKHIRDIGNQTRLSYDINPHIHDLIAAELETLPTLFEMVGQLRGLGTGFIAKQQLSRQEAMQLSSLISQIKLQNKKNIQLTTTILSLTDQHPLKNLYLKHNKLLDKFVQLTEAHLHSSQAMNISPENFFHIGTSTLQISHQFSLANLKYIEHLLKQHIEKQFARQYTLKCISILVILFLLFLFASFYQSVMNTIKALDTAAEGMRYGNMKALTSLPTSDELGHVVHSFNSIAKELTRVSSHMKAVVDHAVVGIITIDKNSIIRTFNPASEKIFDYQANEVLGLSITQLMPKRFRQKHLNGIQEFLNTQHSKLIHENKPLHVYGLRKDHTEFPAEMSISVMEVDGQTMFIAMLRDTSKQHDLEMKLRHAQKMEAIGSLVGGVAHNFNNLLAGIVGQIFMIKMEVSDQPEIIQSLDEVEDITMQASDMIRQLLTFAHKDFFSSKQTVSLSQLIQESFKTVRLGIEENINLSLDIEKVDMTIHCDGSQIQQILMNIANNARDAVQESAQKDIAISLYTFRPTQIFQQNHPELTAMTYANLKISDTGHGIEEALMERIFEPFFTSKEVGKGTGLGLSTAFGTISAHQGIIEVDSTVGKGTTFSIYLPLVKKEEKPIVKPTKKTILHSLHQETLLLVDDEALIVQSMSKALREIGYHVLTAENGTDGLSLFKQHQHDISAIITDVIMPKMSGVEMFQHIHQIKKTMPTLFLTGYDQDQVKLNDYEKKYSQVVPKPIQIAALSHILRSLIDQEEDLST